jgi:glycosyltransferase involved in cell wall biosynthesis
MDMKQRILFLRWRPASFAGAARHLVDWLRGIDYSKNSVFLGSTKGEIFRPHVEALRLPVQCVPLPLSVDGSFFKVFLSWVRFLRRLRPDKIIMGDGYFREWPLATVLAAYAVCGGNVYMSEHTPYPTPTRKASRLHFGFLPGLGLWWYWSVLPLRARAYFSKRIIAVSGTLKNWMVQFYGYPPEKVTVVYHGVDASRFHPGDVSVRDSLRVSLRLPPDATVIVSTARLDVGQKRIDRLIRAFDSIAGERKDLWLLLAGDGPREQELRRQAESSCARERIKFLGYMEDVSPVLRAGDIFVLPSAFEGLSIAMLEAMASELVTVVTNSGASGEAIEDGVNGLLVDVTYEGVLQGLRKALDLSANERRMMGRRARQTILGKFQLGEALKRFLVAVDLECSQGE